MSDLGSVVLVLILVAAAATVIAAGSALAGVGDRLAEQTGLGRVFVGALLIAGATSLPELGTDVSAAIADAPDLAVGDLFGSSMANMAILAIIDLRYRGRVLPTVELSHVRVAAVAIGLTALVVMAITTPSGPAIGGVGVTTIGIAAIYVAALAWFRRVAPIGALTTSPTPFRRLPDESISREATALAADERTHPQSTARLGLSLAGLAVVLLAATPILTLATEELGHRSGVSQTALGVTVLAVTTSLPELATSFAALRIGAHDLAVGNLFGSNAANMAMLLVVDIAYREGPILDAVVDDHAVAGSGAIVLMALALAAIVSGRTNRAQRAEPDSAVILVAYVATVAAVIATSGG